MPAYFAADKAFFGRAYAGICSFFMWFLREKGHNLEGKGTNFEGKGTLLEGFGHRDKRIQGTRRNPT